MKNNSLFVLTGKIFIVIKQARREVDDEMFTYSVSGCFLKS